MTGAASEFEFARIVNVIPGRVLPAEAGRSGSLVLKFGGASIGKSGRSIGRTGARGRGPGELGRDTGAAGFRVAEEEIRLTDGNRLPVLEVEAPDDEVGRRVGVAGRELARELPFALEGV